LKPGIFTRIVAVTIAVMMVASFVLVLAGCSSSDPLADQFREGGNKNYIAGDGTVTEYSEENRPEASPWGGITESGDRIDSVQLEGVVTVMNWWYAACAPCRDEAPDLVELSEQFAADGVQFIGVNVRDTAETALAFARNFEVTYPSIMDSQSGAVSLAFTGVVTPQAVPTTLVIDSDGRVSSKILGRIDKSILAELIETAIER
jgi:peroxiredoxin